jgi:hypothetical protein
MQTYKTGRKKSAAKSLIDNNVMLFRLAVIVSTKPYRKLLEVLKMRENTHPSSAIFLKEFEMRESKLQKKVLWIHQSAMVFGAKYILREFSLVQSVRIRKCY